MSPTLKYVLILDNLHFQKFQLKLTSNSFSIGTTNTFEDKSLNIKNQKFIESVEELHINYVIMLQSTKKLLKYLQMKSRNLLKVRKPYS